MYLLPSIKSVG